VPVLPKGAKLEHTGLTQKDMDFNVLTEATRCNVNYTGGSRQYENHTVWAPTEARRPRQDARLLTGKRPHYRIVLSNEDRS
jgi:hypothetical protein